MEKAESVGELTQQNIETIAAMERAAHGRRTFGEKVADLFAAVVGSWTFIITQSVILTIWVALNCVGWFKAWDPYPFILLNLALSFQAAYASPIIMMSQNRQAFLNDQRNRLDLQINLLAEQENTEMLALLRKICDKLDIPLAEDRAIGILEQITQPEKLVEQIESITKKNFSK